MPKNLCKRTVLVQLIIKNVVTCFLEHSVEIKTHHLQSNAIPTGRAVERFSVNTIQLFPLPYFNFFGATF